MLAISIWQPHATLLALGPKIHETRHWQPSPAILARIHGQRIVIHASKNTSDLRDLAAHIHDKAKGFTVDPVWDPFADALKDHIDDVMALPLGAIVGTAIFKAVHLCTATDDFGPFGNFNPGRYAWEMANPVAFKQPIPWTARQGWFDIPNDVIAQSA